MVLTVRIVVMPRWLVAVALGCAAPVMAVVAHGIAENMPIP